MAYIRLNARECEIINVSKQEEKDFLNKITDRIMHVLHYVMVSISKTN